MTATNWKAKAILSGARFPRDIAQAGPSRNSDNALKMTSTPGDRRRRFAKVMFELIPPNQCNTHPFFVDIPRPATLAAGKSSAATVFAHCVPAARMPTLRATTPMFISLSPVNVGAVISHVHLDAWMTNKMPDPVPLPCLQLCCGLTLRAPRHPPVYMAPCLRRPTMPNLLLLPEKRVDKYCQVTPAYQIKPKVQDQMTLLEVQIPLWEEMWTRGILGQLQVFRLCQ